MSDILDFSVTDEVFSYYGNSFYAGDYDFPNNTACVCRITDNPDSGPDANWTITVQNGEWGLSIGPFNGPLISHWYQESSGDSHDTERANPGNPCWIRFRRSANTAGKSVFFLEYGADGEHWTVLDQTPEVTDDTARDMAVFSDGLGTISTGFGAPFAPPPAPPAPSDGEVFDYGADAGTAVPCPPQYRVAVPSHAPSALPRLGAAVAYRVMVVSRGGSPTVLDIDPATITAVSWERRINDVAEHTVTLAKRFPGLRGLAGIGTWAHELAIWRLPDRGQPELAAVGPLVDWTETRAEVVLTARDLGAWFAKRVIHNAYAFTDGCTDLAEIARHLVNDGLGPDDPGILPYARFAPTGITAHRSGAANKLMLDKELSDLAALGLDWTFVGRRLIVSGDLAAQLPRVARLGGAHFDADVEINAAGAETLTRVFRTNDAAAAAVIGYAGGIDPVLGLLEDTASGEDLISNGTARTAARVALAAAYPTPFYLRVPDGAGLSPGAPVTLDQLIPGVGVRVEVTDYLQPLASLQRLTQVRGAWAADTGEQIQVSLSPWAAVPADDATVVATTTGLGIIDANVDTDPDPLLVPHDAPTGTAPVDPTPAAIIAAANRPDMGASYAAVGPNTILTVTATLTGGATYDVDAPVFVALGGPYRLAADVYAVPGTTASGGVSIGGIVINYEQDMNDAQYNAGPAEFTAPTTGDYTFYLVVSNYVGTPSSLSYQVGSRPAAGGNPARVTRLTVTSRATTGSAGTTGDDNQLVLAPGAQADEAADPDLNATATTDSGSYGSSADGGTDLAAIGGDAQTDMID